jgi:flavin reductase (DIM6/NTAB) family NADH-FMN oxidoreductase RutF
MCATSFIIITHAFHPTTIPPLLDVPVYSLSTLGGSNSSDGKSTMNILTYATPVGIQPNRIWCISLYKGTLSYENFIRERRGVLQLLRQEHAVLTRMLGGSSGRDVDKNNACNELGFAWQRLPNEEEDDSSRGDWPLVLPHCYYYLKLELIGDLIDCGNHDVALCKVVSMITTSSNEVQVVEGATELDSLSTRRLRDDKIISELGRIIPLSTTAITK